MKVKIRADLHIHTCLSPCGGNDMTPGKIIAMAKAKGLKMIAICDHNTCENVKSVADAAKGSGLKVIAGMEMTSREEVHTIGLFESFTEAAKMQDYVYERLEGKNDERRFGEQLLVDKEGNITGKNDKFLLGTPEISLEEAVAKIKEYGGLAIASHIDREAYGVIGQLGFVPLELEYDALEVSSKLTLEEAVKRFAKEQAVFPLITSSDAHYTEDIGKVFTEFELSDASFGSLKEWLKDHGRRRE